MKTTFPLLLVLLLGNAESYITRPGRSQDLAFVAARSIPHTRSGRNPFLLRSRFTDTLYKEIRKRIQRSTETAEQRRRRLDQEERSKRDGLLYPPKTSYEIYIAAEDRPLDEIRSQFGHILSKLKNVGAENLHIYNIGLKKLARPIKKRYEANFLLVYLTVYPSLINFIRCKLLEETGVLRLLILRDDEADKERRIYRDEHLYVRHPFFNKDVYKPYLSRLKDSPYA